MIGSRAVVRVIRAVVKGILAAGLVGTTCAVAFLQPEALGHSEMALLGTLTGMVITHYFEKDRDEPETV